MVQARERIQKLEKTEHALCVRAAKWLQLEEGVDSWIMDYRKKLSSCANRKINSKQGSWQLHVASQICWDIEGMA